MGWEETLSAVGRTTANIMMDGVESSSKKIISREN